MSAPHAEQARALAHYQGQAALSRFDDEERRRDVAAAFENMEASFIAAVLHDQERELPTPAWRKPVARTRLDELVSCLMDRYLAAELLAVLQMAVKRGDDALKASAMDCVRSLARAYADAHAEAA